MRPPALPLTWLEEARHCPSPNYDDRPNGVQASLLVIHNISLPPSEFGGSWIDDFFLNRLDPSCHTYFKDIHQLKVSSHLLIRRDGELVQYVALDKRAWHAGVSAYQGRKQCNDYSIGIELEGCDDQPFEDRQYDRLINVSREIIKANPAITAERIVGHSDISPERKTDPGPYFDWDHYRKHLTTA